MLKVLLPITLLASMVIPASQADPLDGTPAANLRSVITECSGPLLELNNTPETAKDCLSAVIHWLDPLCDVQNPCLFCLGFNADDTVQIDATKIAKTVTINPLGSGIVASFYGVGYDNTEDGPVSGTWYIQHSAYKGIVCS